MSNLKKILSLALAVVMVLSFGLSAAAGAFPDVKDSDDYAAAIDLLFSLEVLKGYEDGTYKAAGAYTREEFSKILYVLMNGKDDNAAMYLGASPFPDVDAGRWSAGYITWAVNAGIVNGREDGLFHPTDVVKYAEAAKMLIIAMGYSGTMYTYPYGFIDKASTLGLFEDLKNYSTFGDANRGTVAQMAYNALFAEAPRFGTYTSKEGDNTVSTNIYTVIEGAFGVRKTSAGAEVVLYGTSTNAYAEPLYDAGQISLDGLVFAYAGDVDAMIGEEVRVWFKPGEKNSDNTTPAADDRIILVEKLPNVKTYILNPKEVDGDRTGGTSVAFKENGVTRRLSLPSSGVYVVTWEGEVLTGDRVMADTFLPGSANGPSRENYFKLIDQDGNGVVDLAYVYEPSFGKVNSVSSTAISTSTSVLSGSNDIHDDDGNVIINLYDGVAKSDRVLVYERRAVVGTGVEDVYDVVKAETVKDVRHNSVDGSSYFFDGVKYKLNTGAPELGKNYDLWLNANGYVQEIDKVSSETAGNWILVNRVGDSVDSANRISSAWVTGYLADGSKKTFYIDLDEVDENVAMDGGVALRVEAAAGGDDNGWVLDGSDQYALAEDRIFAYTLGDNGQIDSFKHVENAKDISAVLAGDDASYDKDTNRLSAGGSGLINDETVIFNKYEGSKYAVLKLSDLPNFSASAHNDVIDGGRDGSDVKVLLIVSATKIGATSDEYGLVIKAIKNAASGSKVNYTLKIAVDGKVENFTSKDVSDGATGTNGGLNDTDLNLTGDNKGKVVGYAKIVRDAAGKVTKLELLNYVENPDLGDGELGWFHGAVTNKSASGRGLTLATVETYTKEDVAGKDVYGFEYSLDDLGFMLDKDCQVYSINIKPYEGLTFVSDEAMYVDGDHVVFDNGKGVSVSSLSNVDKSDLPEGGENGNGVMVDLLIEGDADGAVVKAVFVYNSVSGGEDVTLP